MQPLAETFRENVTNTMNILETVTIWKDKLQIVQNGPLLPLIITI